MRLGQVKPPSLQSQPVTCYPHDLKPGCASRLHEPELPHWGEERVLASTQICFQASPPDPPHNLCVLSLTSHGRTFLLGVILQGVDSQALANDLLAARGRSAYG